MIRKRAQQQRTVVCSGPAGSGQMHTSHLGQDCLKPFAVIILTSVMR